MDLRRRLLQYLAWLSDAEDRALFLGVGLLSQPGEIVQALPPATGGMLDKVINVRLLIRLLVITRQVEGLRLLR